VRTAVWAALTTPLAAANEARENAPGLPLQPVHT
jgi:hypothetical protein